jgi:nitrous oxidase accessory protein NosD
LADIDALWSLESAEGEEYDGLVSGHGSPDDVVDRLITLNPVMKELMNAARPDLGEYTE